MKKVFKFLGAAAAVGAAVAGGIAVYRRFFAPAEDLADLDDEFDDEFEDEDLDKEPASSERGYVSIHTASEEAEEKESEAEASEEEKAEENKEEETVKAEAEPEA